MGLGDYVIRRGSVVAVTFFMKKRKGVVAVFTLPRLPCLCCTEF